MKNRSFSLCVDCTGRRRRRRRRPGQGEASDTLSASSVDENATSSTAGRGNVVSAMMEDVRRAHFVARRRTSHRTVATLTVLLLTTRQKWSAAGDDSKFVETTMPASTTAPNKDALLGASQSPHFPHATFIAHGHPSDPHTHHLHATTYRYYHHHHHNHNANQHQHHDWFHATIENVEPIRLHGGFTYTDAHVPTPLTHRKYDHIEQRHDGDSDDDGENIELVAHPYFSIPGIITADDGADASFPDFQEFQHSVEEQMHIDEEVQKRIDFNVDHPNHEVGSTSVEDLSDIIQTITEQEKSGAAKHIANAAAGDMHQPVSVPSWWGVLGIKQFLHDAALTGLSGHMIALERNCKDEATAADPKPQPLSLDDEAKYAAISSADSNSERGEQENGSAENFEPTKSADNNGSGFKLSMKELLKAMQSTTAVAGMASDAAVAAAAMASAAVEAEEDIKRQDDMVERSATYSQSSISSSGHDARKQSGKQYVVRRDREADGADSDSSSFSDQTDFPELDPFAVETSHLLSASFALVSNSFGLVADTVRILGDTAGAATSASIKVVGATVKSVSGGLEGAGKRIELGRAGLREEALLEGNKAKAGGASHPKKRQPLTSEKLLSGQKGGVSGLLHRDQEDQPRRPLVKGTRRVLGKSVRLLASLGSGVGDSLLFAGTATETLTSATAGVAEEAVRLFEDFAGSLSAAFQVKEEIRPRDEPPASPPSAMKTSDWYSLDYTQQRPSIVSFGRHDSEKLGEDENIERKDDESSEVEDESFIKSSQRLVRYIISESLAYVDFSLAETEDVPSEVPELLGILLLCFVSSLVLLSGSSGDDAKPIDARPYPEERGSDDAAPKVQPYIPPIPTHIIQPYRLRRSGILISGEHEAVEATLDSDSLTADEIDPVAKQEPMADIKPTPDAKDDKSPVAPRALLRIFPLIWHLLRAFVIKPFHVSFCIIKFSVLFFLDRRVILMGIYGVAGLYVSHASQLRSISIARNAEASGFRSVVTAAASGSSMRESAVWFNGLLDEMWRVSVAMEHVKSLRTDDYPVFVTKAMKDALRKKSCRKATGRNNRGDSSVLCADEKPYGGLEPYVSSILGESVNDILTTTSASRPRDITYISLHSFTLGSVPPIIRGMSLKSMNDDDSTVKFDVDLDVLLGDSSIVLGELRSF